MLLSETQAEFNALLERLDESLDIYQDLREQLPESSRRAQLDEMIQERSRLLDQLRPQISEALKMRPRLADQEIEGFTLALEHLMQLWHQTPEHALSLLREQDDDILQSLTNAQASAKKQGLALPESLIRRLDELDQHLAATQVWLQTGQASS